MFFEDFRHILGIARNILANRLDRLVDNAILERIPCSDDRRRAEYRITDKGAALLPALVALRQWGDCWCYQGPNAPSLVDARDGRPVQEIAVRATDGRQLGPADLRWAAPVEGEVASAKAEPLTIRSNTSPSVQ